MSYHDTVDAEYPAHADEPLLQDHDTISPVSNQPPPYVSSHPSPVAEKKTPLPEPTTSSSPFALMSFHMSDRIRLLNFTESDIAVVCGIIEVTWEEGIASTRTYNESYEFKLKGLPWFATSNVPEAKRGRSQTMVRSLLSGLYELGYVFEQSIGVTMKANQKDSMVFRRTELRSEPTDWLGITFEGVNDVYNLFVLHNTPGEVAQRIHQAFMQKGWSTDSVVKENRQEIRLKKAYLRPEGEDTVTVRLMLLGLVEQLEEAGWKIYASLRIWDKTDFLVCQKV